MFLLHLRILGSQVASAAETMNPENNGEISTDTAPQGLRFVSAAAVRNLRPVKKLLHKII